MRNSLHLNLLSLSSSYPYFQSSLLEMILIAIWKEEGQYLKSKKQSFQEVGFFYSAAFDASAFFLSGLDILVFFSAAFDDSVFFLSGLDVSIFSLLLGCDDSLFFLGPRLRLLFLLFL